MTDLPPWHLAPEVIDILASFPRRPRIVSGQHRDGSWWSQYEANRRTAAIHRFWFDTCCQGERSTHSAAVASWQPLFAVFGDPEGRQGKWITHWDKDLAGLRRELHAAALERGHDKLAARIARLQKEFGE